MTPQPRPPLIVIVGPTATGKTEFAVELALALRTEVITADSMQVYRGMDIGTAKPTPAERTGVVHHGIDLVDPWEPFNVTDFRDYARGVIRDMHRRRLLPILAGGTGFYVQAVLEDFPFPEGDSDWDLRHQLEAEAEIIGREALHARLAAVDPVTAARLHPNDVRRVVRALEVYERTGETLSDHIARRQRTPPLYDVLMFGLIRPREELDKRINDRVHDQIAAGLVDEVRAVLQRRGPADDDSVSADGDDADRRREDAHRVAMKGLGYKEIIEYIEGRQSLEEAIERLQRDTRRFARRQMTWFRADKRIRWLDLSEYDSIRDAIAPVISEVTRRWTSWLPLP